MLEMKEVQERRKKENLIAVGRCQTHDSKEGAKFSVQNFNGKLICGGLKTHGANLRRSTRN